MANKVDTFRTKLFFIRDVKNLPLRVSSVLLSLKEEGWTFQVVEQTRGRCYCSAKEITIPEWVCEEKHRLSGQFIQYISHELAHAVHFLRDKENAKREPHGQMFMKCMKEICPPEYWHFELAYKPREAAKAGILHNASEI